eukprot:1160436-Pelagomonas_calceolata.AAC.2
MQEVAGLRQAREEADAEAARMASEMVSIPFWRRWVAAAALLCKEEVMSASHKPMQQAKCIPT